MEIYKYEQNDRTKPGKWYPLFERDIKKSNNRNIFFLLNNQNPKVKVNGKWVKK